MIELEPANTLLDRFPCSSRLTRRAMLEAVKLVEERAGELHASSLVDGTASAFRELESFVATLRTGLELRL